MNTPTPAEGEPARAEFAEAGKSFATLFGQMISAPPTASLPPQRILPPIAETPPVNADGIEAVVPAPATKPEVESSLPISVELNAPAVPQVNIVISAAGSTGLKLQRTTIVEPTSTRLEETANAAPNGGPTHSGQQLTLPATPIPAPAVLEPVSPDTETEIASEPAQAIASKATHNPHASETALAAVAASPAADRAQAATGTPALVSTSPTPPAATEITAQSASPRPEIVLPTRPERLAADVAIEVVRQIGADRSQFTIRLDPPDLGRIDVRLEFDHSKVRAVVTTDNPATHDLLRRDADGLARMLADSGFRSDSGTFRFDLRQDGGQGRAFAQTETHAPRTTLAEADEPLVETARSTRRGLLDLVA